MTATPYTLTATFTADDGRHPLHAEMADELRLSILECYGTGGRALHGFDQVSATIDPESLRVTVTKSAPSAESGPHVPYPGEAFNPVHDHDWADGHCQDVDCAADDRTPTPDQIADRVLDENYGEHDPEGNGNYGDGLQEMLDAGHVDYFAIRAMICKAARLARQEVTP